ncbi:ATP-binding protein [Streptomyces platensis]|uniref:ATP-binding protein n=1 Tax=Streptomyces platensis TaxID=58346 RepID=UPI00386600C9|nr:ATP-binding protein [Streptomyces platensis]
MLEPPTPATWRIALPRGATAVPIARAMVRTAMQDLRVTADRTTAQLLTAELVTNALKHTCGAAPIELVVEQRPSGCRIEVHDDSPLLVAGLGDPAPLGEPGAVVVASGGGAAGGAAEGPSGGTSQADGQVPMQRAEEAGRSGDGADADPDAPSPAAACRDHDGRGLLLIRSLSAASGCRPTPRGKAVWFTLPEVRRRR